jgi:hypothetical protein
MPTTIFYNAYDDDTAHRHQVTLIADYDLDDDSWNDDLAERCADDWHSNHDGWEASWPRTFVLFRDKTGPAFARFTVDREYAPQFSATKANEKD